LSPRMHNTSPGRTAKLTPLTACTVASRVTKRTERSCASTSGALPPAPRSGISRPAVARSRIEHMTGGGMRRLAAPIIQLRVVGAAYRLGERATGMKAATEGRVDRVGWIAGDRRLLDAVGRIHRRPRREQGSRIGMLRIVEDGIDGAQLDDAA